MKISKEEINIIRRTFVDENLFNDQKIYSYYRLCKWFLNSDIREKSLIASQIEFYLKDRLSVKQLSMVRYKFGLEDGIFYSDKELMFKFKVSQEELNEIFLLSKSRLNNSVKLESISIDCKIERINFEINCFEEELQKRKRILEDLKNVKTGVPIDDLLLEELVKKLNFSSKALSTLKENQIESINDFISLSKETIAWYKGMDQKTFTELIEKQRKIKELFSI